MFVMLKVNAIGTPTAAGLGAGLADAVVTVRLLRAPSLLTKASVEVALKVPCNALAGLAETGKFTDPVVPAT